MFSFAPPVILLDTEAISNNVITAYKFFHSTVNSTSYKSVGEERRVETHCIFHYTIKGSGEVKYKGKTYRTKPGDGFFNIINDTDSGYWYYEDATEPWEFVVICMEGGSVRKIVRELLEKKVVYSLNDRSIEKFAVLCKNLLSEGAKTKTKLTFFPTLLSMIYDSDTHESHHSRHFKGIVEREILNNPNVSTIAYEMNISREHLQREFFKENNITPSKYIQNRRFEKLSQLLLTEKNEKEIASMMGFPSLSNMITFFKKFAGITPSQYKKKGYISL